MGKWVFNKPKFQQDKYNIMSDLSKLLHYRKTKLDEDLKSK